MFNVKKIVLPLFYLFVMCVSSCGTTKYMMPTANPALFKEKGEVHVAVDLGVSGASIKSAVSITDNIGIMGQFSSGVGDYQSKDFEIAAGKYRAYKRKTQFLSVGTGFGSNFGYSNDTNRTKEFEGTFVRPFIQLNHGYTGGNIRGGFYGDAILCLKASYLFYQGRYLDSIGGDIRSNYLLIEPAATFGLGTRTLRAYMSMGLVLRPGLSVMDDRYDAFTTPINFSFGLRYIFGRTKENEKS